MEAMEAELVDQGRGNNSGFGFGFGFLRSFVRSLMKPLSLVGYILKIRLTIGFASERREDRRARTSASVPSVHDSQTPK